MNIQQMKLFVEEKHKGQTRIQGTPYFLHPFAVSDILKDNGYRLDYQIVGLFHDLLEDTDATCEELLELSNPEIVKAVQLLTKEEHYEMSVYIKRIEENELAKMVKLADRVHNLSEAHFASRKWILNYIKETEQWYIKMAEGTCFETHFMNLLNHLKHVIKARKEER